MKMEVAFYWVGYPVESPRSYREAEGKELKDKDSVVQ